MKKTAFMKLSAILFSALILMSASGCDFLGGSSENVTESSIESSEEISEDTYEESNEKPDVQLASEDEDISEGESKKDSSSSKKSGSDKEKSSVKETSKNKEKSSTENTDEDEQPEKQGDFSNLSYWSAIDKEVRITGLASVDSKNLKYCFQFRRTSNKKWNLIGEKYSGKSTATFTPEDGVKYEIRVRIKDENDGVVEKKFTVSTDYFGLENTTKIKNTEIKKGTSLKITAHGTGGSEPYTYAYYFKRASNDIWNSIGTEFGTDDSAKLKPNDTGDYDIRVFVKDSNEQAVVKKFTIKVK